MVNMVDPISTVPTKAIFGVLRSLPGPPKERRKDGSSEPRPGFICMAHQACVPVLHV